MGDMIKSAASEIVQLVIINGAQSPEAISLSIIQVEERLRKMLTPFVFFAVIVTAFSMRCV
jgi:hypothetical protein